MYFPDLTPYHYGRTEPEGCVLNVGWLSASHEFPRGAPDKRLVAAVRLLIASPIKLHRGYHICEFCPLHPDGMSASPAETKGNGEIRVKDKNGIIYAAPVLILHYILEHEYRPPKEFIDAVLSDEGLGFG